MDIPRMGLPDHLAGRLSMAEQHELLTRRVRRRSVLALPALAFVPAAARVSGEYVVPFGRHLAFGADPRTQMRVSWQVAHPVDKPYVRVGLSPWNLGGKIAAEVRPLHSASPHLARHEQFYVHAAVDGLAPGTTYFYAVGHRRSQGFRRTASFTTAPARPMPFTFTAFGDQGVSSHALATDGQVRAQNPAFHLHAGDLCYADSSGHGLATDLYDPRRWDQYLAQTEPVAARIPWMVTMGNHDMEALYSPDGYGGQVARWSLPDSDVSSAVGVYSFVYGNVGVVSLDANDVSYEVPHNYGYTGGAQTAWLNGKLAELRSRPDVDFVVVFFHHSAYCTNGSHASEGGVRGKWVPLFDKYAVDLVINGHNHVYERTDALRAGVARETPVGDSVTDGTIYVTAGAGGRGLYRFPVPDSYAGNTHTDEAVPSFVWGAGGAKVPEVAHWSRVRYTDYSFLAVDAKPAHPATLTLRGIAESGAEFDRVVIHKKARPL